MHGWPAEPATVLVPLPSLILQSSGPSGVEIPLFPLAVALVGIAAILFVGLGALRMPQGRSRPSRRPAARPHAGVPTTPAVAPAQPAPIFKKAPVQIGFPMIKAHYPDVWGVRERATITFKIDDPALSAQRQIPGLVAKVGDLPVPLVFYRGEARLDRVFGDVADVPITVELKVNNERLPRRATRTLRIVDYREEIAELFHRFKDDASQKVTPLRTDATAWEAYDALLDAKPDLPQTTLREVVSSFEEAKFSNHPVGRPTYEKMVHALRVLKIGEV